MSIYDLTGHPCILAKFAIGSIVTDSAAKAAAAAATGKTPPKVPKLKKTSPGKNADTATTVVPDVSSLAAAASVAGDHATAMVDVAIPYATPENSSAENAEAEGSAALNGERNGNVGEENRDKENVPMDVDGAAAMALADDSRKYLGMIKRFDPTVMGKGISGFSL